LEGVATLDELEKTWSLDDLMRATAILDMKVDIRDDMERKREIRKP